jgi:hypothetical protein
LAKVTVYVDDDVWSRFRASVFHKHGSLKTLSREVEGSLRSTLPEEDLLQYLEGLKAGINSRSRTRPSLRGPPAEAQVRMMRRKRAASISGH